LLELEDDIFELLECEELVDGNVSVVNTFHRTESLSSEFASTQVTPPSRVTKFPDCFAVTGKSAYNIESSSDFLPTKFLLGSTSAFKNRSRIIILFDELDEEFDDELLKLCDDELELDELLKACE
jgi:hypothetical protein